MRKVVQNTEHGGQRGAAEGTEERAGSLLAGVGGEERRLLQHDLAHRGRQAGSTSPDGKEAGRSPPASSLYPEGSPQTPARGAAALGRALAGSGTRIPQRDRLPFQPLKLA